MSTQLNLLLEMVDRVPGQFDAFLAQVKLSPEAAATWRQGLVEGASPDEAKAAAAALAEIVWAFLENDQPESIVCT